MSVGNITLGSAVSSIITHGSNGTFRLTALAFSATAALMTAELGLRLINYGFNSIGLKPQGNGVLVKMSEFITKTGLRTFGNEFEVEVMMVKLC